MQMSFARPSHLTERIMLIVADGSVGGSGDGGGNNQHHSIVATKNSKQQLI